MTSQSAFVLRGRNPDILTCIANLSNDEVFTPPELANQMLDTLAQAWAANNDKANIWADKTVTFLDPCTKSGVFLREITSRLTEGLKDAIPDLQKRVDHILTKQVFGIGITQITSLLARRSVYCSKYANGKHSIADSFTDEAGNIWFERTKHIWDGNKCKYCGANQRDYDRGPELETHAYAFIHTDDLRKRLTELFGGKMQFDVVIGNPPYQLGQSGGEAVGGFAMPIYQEFVRAAKRLDPKFVIMITPSRWFAGGRGLDEYRSEMLRDRRIRELVDFPNAREVFPGTQIEGGVSYFLWDDTWNDACTVSTFENGELTSPPMRRNLDAYDIHVRRNEAVPILEKVLRANQKTGLGNLAAKVSPIQPFSIRTNFRGSEKKSGLKKPILVIGNNSETYMERADVPRNDSWIDDWKVLLGRAYGAGGSFPIKVYNQPILAGPGTVCTETYLVIGRFPTEREAKKLDTYLRTRFVRFLVSLRKNTQDIFNERFQFVPDLPMDREWTDKELYKKYGLTKEEIEFIESMIRPMEAGDE
jgi:site-specific DNA-methyltransferase (adenine-specific)